MSVYFEQIEPAVVVVIDKSVAPAHKGNRCLRHAGLVAHIGKAGVAVIAVQHFVVVAEVRHKEVEQPVVLVVAYGDAHRSNLAPILVQRKPRDVTLIIEGAIALVDVKKVRFRVVSD